MTLDNPNRWREWLRCWSFCGLLSGSIGHGWFAVEIGPWYVILKNREVYPLLFSQRHRWGWRWLFSGKRWWCGVRTEG